MKLKDDKNGEAADLLELARKHFPYDEAITLSLSRVYLKLDEDDKLQSVLETYAARHFDDETVRKKLAEIAFKKKDYKAVVKYGREVLFIDVLDVDVHRMIGDAYRELKDYKKSAREFEVALQIKPDTASFQIGLARTHVAAGEKDKAKVLLDAVLKNDAENAEAKTLLKSLDQP